MENKKEKKLVAKKAKGEPRAKNMCFHNQFVKSIKESTDRNWPFVAKCLKG